MFAHRIAVLVPLALRTPILVVRVIIVLLVIVQLNPIGEAFVLRTLNVCLEFALSAMDMVIVRDLLTETTPLATLARPVTPVK